MEPVLFLTAFTDNLDEGIKTILRMFADDTEVSRSIDLLEGRRL